LEAGARPGNAQRLYLPATLVEWALRSAPSAVEVYDRRGNLAFGVGDGSPTRFGIGVTSLYYQDPQSDAVRPFTRANLRDMVRLGGALPQFDLISTVGVPRDVHPTEADLYAALEMAANTTKPLVLLVAHEQAFPHILDLLETLHGDLGTRPFVVPYVNPVTPLVMNAGTSDKMRWTVERGLPLIFSSYGMAGASTPITPSGTLTLLHAELLAGLTLSQLLRPGTSVILGCLPAVFDMRGLVPVYAAHSYVMNLACAEMMAHYRLPHAGTSGSGIGWGPDPIAFGHQWMNHLTALMGCAGLVPFVGDNLGSTAFSPVLAVYADLVLAQARRLARGFALDEASDDLAEIGRAGPGGSFLQSATTRRLFRDAYERSAVWPNYSVETWQELGCPRAMDALRAHTLELMATAQAPDDHEDLLARGEAFIARLDSES